MNVQLSEFLHQYSSFHSVIHGCHVLGSHTHTYSTYSPRSLAFPGMTQIWLRAASTDRTNHLINVSLNSNCFTVFRRGGTSLEETRDILIPAAAMIRVRGASISCWVLGFQGNSRPAFSITVGTFRLSSDFLRWQYFHGRSNLTKTTAASRRSWLDLAMDYNLSRLCQCLLLGIRASILRIDTGVRRWEFATIFRAAKGHFLGVLFFRGRRVVTKTSALFTIVRLACFGDEIIFLFGVFSIAVFSFLCSWVCHGNELVIPMFLFLSTWL